MHRTGGAVPDERSLEAYRTDWRDFESWCGRRGFHALPSSSETVALYLRARADDGLRPSTLRRRLASIAWQHRQRRRPSPCSSELVRTALREIERISEVAVDRRVPITLPNLRRLISAVPDNLNGLRDRAIMSLSFMAALGRGELVQLNAEQLTATPAQLVIEHISGRPQTKLPRARDALLCPVRSHESWIAASGIAKGPLYRPVDRHGRVLEQRLSDRAVGLIVTRAAEHAGLPADEVSADSLRLGGAAFGALGLSLDDIPAAQ